MQHLIKASLDSDTELFRNYSRIDNHLNIEQKMNFRENPYVHMFYKPQNSQKEELFVPDCDDFVVFYVKNSKMLKTYKLF